MKGACWGIVSAWNLTLFDVLKVIVMTSIEE